MCTTRQMTCLWIQMVTALLEDLVNHQGKTYDEAVIIGPMIMMKFASMTTKLNIPTIVSLNTIMVDGTGMCGACRSCWR